MSNDVLLCYAKKYFTSVQLEKIRQIPLHGPNGLRRWIAQRDIEAFIKLYFDQEFTLPFAPIHYQMLEDMQQVRDRQAAGRPGLKLARAIPRNHAKSSFYSRLLPLHGFLFAWSPLTVLLANNEDAARRLTSNIKTTIESNIAIREDFPDIKGSMWGNERLESSSNCVITGYGSGSGSVRGLSIGQHRPSLIVADDIDDDRSVRSSVELANNVEWWDKAVSALGDNVQYTTSYIAAGTLIRKTSLMQHILNSPDYHKIIERRVKNFAINDNLWKQWEENYINLARNNQQPRDASEDVYYQQNKAAMLAGTQVLWDKQDEYYNAMVYRLARGEKAFASEMQNEPQDTTGAFSNIKYVSLPADDREYDLLAALDPTTTGNKTSDLAAFVEILFHRKRKEIIVSYVDAKQRSYSDTIDDITRRIKDRGRSYQGFWIETNAHGLVIQDLLQQRFAQESILLLANGIYNSVPKAERIDALSHYIANGQLLFAADNEALKEELDQWPLSKHDDCLDALATIVMYLKENGLLDLIHIDGY